MQNAQLTTADQLVSQSANRLVDRLVDRLADKKIHIFNGFLNPFGGSELEALSLYGLLKSRADVQLWATSSRVSRDLMRRFPIRRVAMHKGAFPKGGNYIFVGAHWRNKLWPYFIPKPDRLIYVFNTFHPKVVSLTSNMPRLLRWPRTEFVLISEFQRSLLNLDGEVHPSPIDIGQFMPSPREQQMPPVIGRLSRDAPDKHNPADIPLYESLVRQGYELRLQGATCIADQLPSSPKIHVMPEGHLPAPEFLHGLDVFYYRTGAHVETFGRVVFEAMACGLPVVCHSHGGYAGAIRHGENGFLFDSTEEAQVLIERLMADRGLRVAIGDNARKTVEALYSEAAQEERLGFYLK